MLYRVWLAPLCIPLLAASLVAPVVSGCDDGPDAPLDAGPSDAGSSDASATPDSGAPPSCDPPAAIIGGTTQTDSLANAPARCGQPAHTWLRDDALGSVVESSPPMRYTSRILSALVEGAGGTVPREPADDVAVREYRYMTQDRGALVETTATVAYPTSRPAGEALDVLLFLHGTSGFTNGCGPSEDETGLLAALLASYGYIVVMPDFLGLEWGEATYGELHPYLVGQAVALPALDAVRAAMRIDVDERGGVCAAPRVVTVGGSQGGHAALWVDRLAPYYARELTHLGVVATVPPADLYGEVERALSSLVDASANVAAMYATMPYWYGIAPERLAEIFEAPFDTELPAALRAECSPDRFDGLTMLDELYRSEMIAAATEDRFMAVDPWACLAAENGLTTTSIARIPEADPSYGILYVLAENDSLVHTPTEREAYRTLCEAGVPLSYLECAGASHGGATLWALPELLDFVDARSAGDAFVAGACEPAGPVTCRGTPEP